MQKLFQVGQVVEIRIIDDGFNADDYYIVSIVAIHGSKNEIIYYTSSPVEATSSSAGINDLYVLDLHIEQRIDLPLRLMSGFKILVTV